MKRSTRRVVLSLAFALSVGGLGGGVWHMARTSIAGGSSVALGTGLTGKMKHRWRSVRARHWQIISTELEDPETTDAREGTRGNCPTGMVQVKGNMKLDPDENPNAAGRLERMQLRTCIDWIQKEYPERCRKFDRARWLEMTEELETKSMEFCIDRFEYPNLRGQFPMIYVSWYEATDMCKQQGKRLCNEDEWTFACEGEEAVPYPYGDGYTRDPQKCITDQPWVAYNERAMVSRSGDAAAHEMDRLWRGKASGSQTECTSVFGVYDMTGNVDEWTHTARPGERPSILKGGYWGPVRTRCRPTTRSHDENHMFYQQGVRCCADAGADVGRSLTVEPSGAGLPGPVE